MNENEPEYDYTTGEPPAWLGKKARVVWRELAPIYIKSKVLNEGNLETFGKYCAIAADTRRLSKKLTNEKNRRLITHLVQQERLLAVEFGMTSASATRIRVDKEKNGPEKVLDRIWQRKS